MPPSPDPPVTPTLAERLSDEVLERAYAALAVTLAEHHNGSKLPWVEVRKLAAEKMRAVLVAAIGDMQFGADAPFTHVLPLQELPRVAALTPEPVTPPVAAPSAGSRDDDDGRGLAVDMLDADRLRAWAHDAETASRGSAMHDLANRLATTITEIGSLRESLREAIERCSEQVKRTDVAEEELATCCLCEYEFDDPHTPQDRGRQVVCAKCWPHDADARGWQKRAVAAETQLVQLQAVHAGCATAINDAQAQEEGFRKEIALLQTEHDYERDAANELRDIVAELRQDRDALRTALAKFGGHTRGCKTGMCLRCYLGSDEGSHANIRAIVGYRDVCEYDPSPCSCGYKALTEAR